MGIKAYLLKAMEKKRQTHEIRKEQHLFKQALRGAEYRGTEVLFNQNTLAWLVVVVTVFLQIISLATTYEGSKVYFGGILLPLGLSAPLLFAIAIQSIVFSMSHVIRRYFKVWLAVILLLATVCSTYFSYIGIYNHINSPISYLEERYTQIHDRLTKQYDLVIEHTEGQMKTYVFDLVNAMSEKHTHFSKKLKENQELEQLIESIEVKEQTINPQINALARPNRGDYGEDIEAYYEAMRSYNAAVSGMISDTAAQGHSLTSTIRDQEIKGYLGGKTREAFIEEGIAIETSKEQLEKTVDAMYILIAPEGEATTFDEKLAWIQSYCLNFIIQKQGNKEHFSALMTQLHTVVNTLNTNNDFKLFSEDLGHFMLFNDEEVTLMKDLETLKQEVVGDNGFLKQEDAMLLYTNLNSEIKRAAYQLNQMRGLETSIDLNEETYSLYNLYVLPIKNVLVESDVRPMAWFCLGFALLIDGLTLLFALMQGREKTMLFAKSNKEAVGKSKEAIEELLLTAIRDDGIGKKDNIVESISYHLTQFLRPLNLIPEGLESGYSMWCPVSKLEHYSIFIAVLCQFNFATILGKDDLIWIEDHKSIEDERYLLVKTKFIIWAKQKIADLALKQDYIESVHDLDRVLQVEGERI